MRRDSTHFESQCEVATSLTISTVSVSCPYVPEAAIRDSSIDDEMPGRLGLHELDIESDGDLVPTRIPPVSRADCQVKPKSFRLIFVIAEIATRVLPQKSFFGGPTSAFLLRSKATPLLLQSQGAYQGGQSSRLISTAWVIKKIARERWAPIPEDLNQSSF